MTAAAWPPPRPEDHEFSLPVACGPTVRAGGKLILNPDGFLAGSLHEARRAAIWAETQLEVNGAD